MPTVNVTWPKDADGNMFSIHDWIKTLPLEEQEEWSYADNEHHQMIVAAAANGDAELESDTIHWKSDDVWLSYQTKYLTPKVRTIEEKYWTRFLEQHNLKMSDIFGIPNPL
jgi:hypothetical protein